MRQDPPFDLGYITATHLLERIADETLVVNDPVSVRNAPEKVFVLDYARFMPPTLITRSLDEVRAFQAEHGDIVIKLLHGNAGRAVFRLGAIGATLAAPTDLFGQVWVEPFTEHGRTACRERGCSSVCIAGVADSFNKQIIL